MRIANRDAVFFDSWQGLGRVVAVGILAYGALVLLLRLSGNRTLSKLNAFDLVVTVALGSTLATIVLNENVALVEGVLAIALLVTLQFGVTWCSVRWSSFSKLMKSEPVLLVHRGTFLRTAMRRARVVESEVLAVLRRDGFHALEDVRAVVLESDGSLTVLGTTKDGPLAATTLRNVRTWDGNGSVPSIDVDAPDRSAGGSAGRIEQEGGPAANAARPR